MLKTVGLTNTRLRVITLLIPIIFVILIGRLFYWMVLRGPELQTKASRQHETVTILKAKRGDILDAEGSVLAGTKNLYHLFVYKPQLTISKNDLTEKLLSFLQTDKEASTEADLRNHLQGRLNLDSNWISLKHYLTDEEKIRIEAEKIAGLGFEDEYVRYYPDASVAGQILGFVGQDAAGQEQGYFGLEGFYDRLLKGREGRVRTEKDAQGNPILIGNYQLLHSVEGKSLRTTLDKRMQYLAESMLKEGIQKYQAISGNIIIMETKTGKIKTMAAFPNYDPGKFSEFESNVYKNPAVADLFEPGSVFKPLVMVAGLNENLVTPETACDICSGPITIGSFVIRTWDETYRKGSSMTDVIIHSDNTGMVFVARKLGREKFAEYMARYGFGKKTKIQLQEEVSGTLREVKNYGEIDLATNSFGQGIAVTPIQLVSAINAIANSGTYISPTLVEDSVPDTRVILSQSATAKMTEIMKQAVEEGEAKWAKPQGLSVAGKTGTAQIPIAGHYDAEKTIASFIGFFPSENPQYTMLVTLREPKTSIWGSETAAPLWFALAKQLLL